MLWPRLRSESRQQRPGTQRPAGFPEGTAAHATWVPGTEPGSYQQQFWEIGAIIISLCPRARSHSSEKFSNLPRVTQPDLGSQVFNQDLLDPKPAFPPCPLQAVWPRLSSPRTLLSEDGPSQPSKPMQESQSRLTRGRTRAQPC